MGKRAGGRVVVARGRRYSQRWAERIVGYRLGTVAYLCINRPVRHSWYLSEFTMALLHIFTYMNNFSFLSWHFTHPFSTSHKLTTLQMVLLFIEMLIVVFLFSLLLLLLLLLFEAVGLVLGFAAVYYSPHILHTYTKHFSTS